MDRGNGSVLKAGWSPAWVAIVLAIALAGLPAAAGVHPAAQEGGTALTYPANDLTSAPSVLGASVSRGLVPSEASPVPGVGWEALSHASNGLSPPDVQVAVGPDHIVEAVNSALGIYTKLGASVTNTNLSTLFSSGSDLVGDPRILYDAFAGRWFVSAGDISRGQVLVAVSKTGDPAGNWSTYQVPSVPTSSCLDQPVLGVGTWNLIVSVNAFSSCPSPQRGSFYNLDTGDFRIADALWSRGLLWLAFNDQCRTTFSWTACARLIELDTEANAVLQDFWVSSTLRDYFYPALALDGYGNLALIVGVSSSNDYPGLLVTGRLRDDPHGEFQPPVPVKAGSGAEESWCSSSNNRCRYGDYFGASPDPTDPTRVWL